MVKDKVGKDRAGAVREAKATLQVPDVAVAGKDLVEARAVATGRAVDPGKRAVDLEVAAAGRRVVDQEAAAEATGTVLGSRRSPTRPRSGTYSKRGVVTWKKSWHR